MIEYNILLEFVDIDVRQAPSPEVVDDNAGDLSIVAWELLTKPAKKKAKVITTKKRHRLFIHTQEIQCSVTKMLPQD